MRRKRFFLIVLLLLCTGIVIGNRVEAISLIQDDVLTISGYIRSEADVHTGATNPNNADTQGGYNHWQLFRNTLITDLYFKPSEHFKMYARFKIQGDFTDQIDSNLPKYNAFPTYKGRGSGNRLGTGGSNVLAEVRDIYADFSFGDLWVRAGKQQIVWGESDALRLLDVFNPLDLTQHMFFEPAPEQFENIRIPVWALRATYAIPNRYIDGLAIEGVFNPGDIVATQLAPAGAPFNLVPHMPRYVTTKSEERWGDLSAGGRILGKLGPVNVTFNYLYTYNQDGITRNKGLFFDPINGIPFWPGGPPMSVLVVNEHPKINIFGSSFNWAIEAVKGVFRGEFTYTPDQPYESRRSATMPAAEMIRKGTFKYVLGFDKSIRIFPTDVTPAMMQSGFQFFQTIREGDPHDLAINQAKVDRVDNTVTAYFNQPFANETYVATLLGVYDLKGSWWIQPGFKYKPGMHWIFDVYGNAIGGWDKRAYKIGALDWGSGFFGRITYQF